ncbi:MAG: type I restriction enzyme HsdR N-terminal domain-containing protein, partial [Tannerellaceae bacterium]|nr:type I restriction enzyme HsdR N-terminal domain-containing protein [Tannerellaceae bacterium]
MDFKDVIKQLAERVIKMKDSILTEEATKTAFVLPFINALGYDVFNPMEVLPEFICDIGTKKGEKIDYAIIKEDEPIILIECKHCGQDLNLHDNQLLRYFHVSKAKFGILTNGIIYKFYTDLEKENIMDKKPFFEFNFLDIKDEHIEEIR